MISVDTSILLYAFDSGCPEHDSAMELLQTHASDPDFAVCELVLVELYVLLRNPAILERPLSAPDAVDVIQTYRANRHWRVIETADGIMTRVWRHASDSHFARRRIFDVRLALILVRAGVTEWATRNVEHFTDLGLARVWDPIDAGS